MTNTFDAVILGAGLYGLYAAKLLADHGRHCLVLEWDATAMRRATWINQARVHNGYHYPRSLSTAIKSAHYYRRFHEDFDFCILRDFQQIYATSAQFSWTDRRQFAAFCAAAEIPCRELSVNDYFREGQCDGAFLTEEDTYDAGILREYYLKELAARSEQASLLYDIRVERIHTQGGELLLDFTDCRGAGERRRVSSPLLLNATYASVNQILMLVNEGLESSGAAPLPLFPIKYELCEIILCKPSERLKDTGITVMDGPFFSIMPFGKTGLHSLTAVTHTPHTACREDLPAFPCQRETDCSRKQLSNCNDCVHKPMTAWPYMRHLADKYLLPEYAYQYDSSLFSMKPILRSTEVDDARPTAIREDLFGNGVRLVSVLSGKINTVYDLDEVLL